jgi:hypothetical protein
VLYNRTYTVSLRIAYIFIPTDALLLLVIIIIIVVVVIVVVVLVIIIIILLLLLLVVVVVVVITLYFIFFKVLLHKHKFCLFQFYSYSPKLPRRRCVSSCRHINNTSNFSLYMPRSNTTLVIIIRPKTELLSSLPSLYFTLWKKSQTALSIFRLSITTHHFVTLNRITLVPLRLHNIVHPRKYGFQVVSNDIIFTWNYVKTDQLVQKLKCRHKIQTQTYRQKHTQQFNDRISTLFSLREERH